MADERDPSEWLAYIDRGAGRQLALAQALIAMGKAGDDLSGPVVVELGSALYEAALDLRGELQEALAASGRSAENSADLGKTEAAPKSGGGDEPRVRDLPPGTVFHQIALPDEVKLARAYRDLGGRVDALRVTTIALEALHHGIVIDQDRSDDAEGFALLVGHVCDLARGLRAEWVEAFAA